MSQDGGFANHGFEADFGKAVFSMFAEVDAAQGRDPASLKEDPTQPVTAGEQRALHNWSEQHGGDTIDIKQLRENKDMVASLFPANMPV